MIDKEKRKMILNLPKWHCDIIVATKSKTLNFSNAMRAKRVVMQDRARFTRGAGQARAPGLAGVARNFVGKYSLCHRQGIYFIFIS